jgi:ribosomal protein S18 acetylase RimI-like enzyme
MFRLVVAGCVSSLSKDIRLRSWKANDSLHVSEVYFQGFKKELEFFFRRLPQFFFCELLRLLGKDTIVAEADANVVGFVIAIRGLRNMLQIRLLRLAVLLPVLLVSARSPFLLYLLQKMRNTDWGSGQTGIACIAVSETYRRRGIGSALMHKALGRHTGRDAVLDVRSRNKSAISLYTKTGFEKTATWRDGLGEWILMRRPALQADK